MTSPATPARARYQQYLNSLQRADATNQDIAEDDSVRLGAFRFMYTGTPPYMGDRAAVSAQHVVTISGTEGWHAFLQAGSASDVAQRIAWFMGTSYVVGQGDPELAKTPQLAALVADPAVIRDERDTLTLTVWMASTPGFSLSRLTIVAPAAGAARITWTAPGELLSSPAVQAGQQAVRGDDTQTAVRALQALQGTTGAPAQAVFLAALRHASPAVREQAVRGLGSRGERSAVPALAAALPGEPAEDIRVQLVMALAELGGEQARAALHKAAQGDTSELVRELAAAQM